MSRRGRTYCRKLKNPPEFLKAGVYFTPENWYFLCPSIPLELGVVW
jgi:hypothetical protein